MGGGGVSCLPVIVGRDLVRNPRRVGVGINDTDGRDLGQAALVQQGHVLLGIQAHDEIGRQGSAVDQVVIVAVDWAIKLVHHGQGRASQQLLAVGDGSGAPLGEQVAGLGELGGAHDDGALTGTGADEQDQTAVVGDLLDDAGGAAQVGGCGLERDDVDALADAVDVAGVGRVPERRVVTHVGLGGHEILERGFRRRVAQVLLGDVADLDARAELLRLRLSLLEELEVGGDGLDFLLEPKGLGVDQGRVPCCSSRGGGSGRAPGLGGGGRGSDELGGGLLDVLGVEIGLLLEGGLGKGSPGGRLLLVVRRRRRRRSELVVLGVESRLADLERGPRKRSGQGLSAYSMNVSLRSLHKRETEIHT